MGRIVLIEDLKSIEILMLRRSELTEYHVAAVLLEDRTRGSRRTPNFGSRIFIRARGKIQESVDGISVDVSDVHPMASQVIGKEPIAKDQHQSKRGELNLDLDGALRSGSRLSGGAITIDPRTFRVQIHGETIDVVRSEFRLLYLFLLNIGQMLHKSEILIALIGANNTNEGAARVAVNRLRKVLGTDPSFLIETVRGVGYRFHAKKP